MVIVLVPTEDSFSRPTGDRADRRHLIAANHSGTANDSTAESLAGFACHQMASLLVAALELDP
jgi:hypothetical protein